MQNNHNSFFSWCLYGLKHKQLFQIVLWNVGEVVNPIPTVGTGEESGTEQGTLACATWPSPAAIPSHMLALITVQSLHSPIPMGNPKPQGTKSLAGPLSQHAGETNNGIHTLIFQVHWSQKLTKPFLYLLLVLTEGANWPCSFSSEIQLLLTVFLKHALAVFPEICASSCLYGVVLLLQTLQSQEVPIVSFSLEFKLFHFCPMWGHFCDQQIFFSTS